MSDQDLEVASSLVRYRHYPKQITLHVMSWSWHEVESLLDLDIFLRHNFNQDASSSWRNHHHLVNPVGAQQIISTIQQSIPLHVGEDGMIALADECRQWLEPADEWACHS